MKKNKASRFLLYVVVSMVMVGYIFPLYWLLIGVSKINIEHQARPPVFFKFDIDVALTNLKFAIYNSPVPGNLVLKNSLIIAVATAVITVVIGSLAAYAFARFNTGGKNFPFLILALRMVPGMAIGLPFFIVFRFLHLVDTRLGLIIAYVALDLPFVVWTMRSFFREMDPVLEEAARIDGASEIQVFRLITAPLAAPAFATAGLLVFINSWNEFFLANILTRYNARTIPSLLPLFLPREMAPTQPIGSAFALAFVGIIPVVILAFFLQRYMIEGLSYGAVKG